MLLLEYRRDVDDDDDDGIIYIGGMSNVHTTKRGKQGCVSPDRRFPYPSNFARFIIIIAIQSLTHMDKIIIIILISGQTTKYCIVSVAETERVSE